MVRRKTVTLSCCGWPAAWHSLAFCGLEFTIPDDSSFDPSMHLCWGDLAVDNPIDPAILSVTLKASKTDPFRRGITLYIGRVASDLCPVSAVLAYLVARGKRSGPLFMFKNGRPLTRQRLMSAAVRDALERAGVEADKYAGHSFRIGAATTAASRGLEDSTIQTLGRWRSLAYLEYTSWPATLLDCADSVQLNCCIVSCCVCSHLYCYNVLVLGCYDHVVCNRN